jgi:NitT/TauT family transport system substrate-binding protein
VTIDAGNGSGGTVTRVASGTYDMGFADLAALMEFHANNPDAPNKPVAVMMVYNNTPAAVLALKKSGITKPGRPERQEARRTGVRRRPPRLPRSSPRPTTSPACLDQHGPAPARDHAVRGDVDAITGFSFTSLLNLEARGVKDRRRGGAALPVLSASSCMAT